MWSQTILVSDLSFFTDNAAITAYFTKFGVVEKVGFILSRDGTYTRCCMVRMVSVDSVATILEKARHFIDMRGVSVEQYRGRDEHQWIYLKGKFKVTIKGLEVNLCASDLYKKLENAFVGCGRYSEIHLMEDHNGSLTGFVYIYCFLYIFLFSCLDCLVVTMLVFGCCRVAVIDFIKKSDIRQALKIAREDLHCVAFRSKTDPRALNQP
ncbi:nucleotide-binding alpha-beta plait domain-containing protein [Artemisia annua]|uniref:Nucleotide-binding alpha-beta plait domain-containing protein n=1 Tax=Artemisia annua TaxID=35608 RepID=A0A2U1KL91_ARTAN|nr:nucleotide-binding alpha-beta plait domain-containing protein [Artemisia annua]